MIRRSISVWTFVIVNGWIWLSWLAGCTGQIGASPSGAGNDDTGVPVGGAGVNRGDGASNRAPPGSGSSEPGAPPRARSLVQGAASSAAGSIVGGATSACTASPSSVRIRRLTKLEIANTVSDLLGKDAAALTAGIEADTFATGYSTGDERSVTPSYVDALQVVAENIADQFRTTVSTPAFDAACFTDDASARTCAEQFVRRFGARAYRRPFEDADVAPLLAVYDLGREVGADGDAADRFRSGLDWTLRAILQSPEFVFRTELGDPAASPGTSTTLTPVELASALSYGILASPPDDELTAAAVNGELASPAAIAAQVSRLASSYADRFATQAVRFAMEWLQIDLTKPDWNKSPELYPNVDGALKDALQQETTLFVTDWARSGAALPDLLTSSRTFLNAKNAPLYGKTIAGDAFQKVDVGDDARAGILTQPSFLGSHAHADSSSPVLRGVALLKDILCQTPPPVPAMVPPLPPVDPAAKKTTRDRFAAHENSAFCSACHSHIDPMGDAFEGFDAIGARRTEENGIPVDTSGAVVGTVSSDGPVGGAVQLVTTLANTEDAHACFARQVFRFVLGRLEGDSDGCALAEITRGFEAGHLELGELLAAIASSPSFVTRAVPAAP